MTLSRLLVDLHWDPKLISPFFVLELEWLGGGRLGGGRLGGGRLGGGRLDGSGLDGGRLGSGRLDSGRLGVSFGVIMHGCNEPL